MNKAEKIEKTEQLKKEFEEADAVFVSDYRGLQANTLLKLRFELNKSGSRFKIVKNRMALRALKEDVAKDMESHFDNMTAVTIAKGDVAASAKTLTKFAKDNEALKIRAGILEQKVISLAEIKALSTLPSREQLLGQLLSVWNQVPTGFVRVLNAIPGGWVNVLDSLKRKKESEG
jgi:large subunit ribosomal protein L10